MIAGNLFSNATINQSPFPHIIWEKLLDDKIYEKLQADMPTNLSYKYAVDILHTGSNIWKEYVRYFTGKKFHKQILNAFGISMNKSVGLRKRDKTKYVTESFITIRQPKSDWCLYPHIDSPWAVTSMIHYFKRDNDTDNSGDFVILKPKKKIEYIEQGARIRFADPDCFDIVKTIPYSKNTAICVLVGPSSWHGILPRVSNERRTVNISYEKNSITN